MPRAPYRNRWRTVRLQALQRDGYRCCRCGKAGRLEVDHVVPLKDGGAHFDLANLQTLCRGCHIAKTRAERTKDRPWDRMLAELL